MRRILMALGLVLAPILSPASAAQADPSFWQYEWPNTDFSVTTVDNWVEILSGGPPRDGIPALYQPRFIDQARETRLAPREPVMVIDLEGHAPRAYPLRYLMWHEIVNDRIGRLPIAVTFCPLCNSALVFDRRVAQGELTFGVSGKLRNSDMVMYDHETESWWQQALGTGIVGEMTGVELTLVPSWMQSWQAFQQENPDGQVMDQPDYPRAYGANPYRNYDSASRPFLYNGENPPHGIAPLVRVIRVGDAAWPMARLREERQIRENGVVLSWEAEQASALDSGKIARGKPVGAVRVRDGQGRDLAHDVMFAFAFHAFWPHGQWMLGEGS